jgi:hypothetical protein
MTDFLPLVKSENRKNGGKRPGAGRPPKMPKLDDRPPEQTPLAYMLSVMNDPKADVTRRDRMATAAAPYVHGRSPDTELGKKQMRQIEAQTAHEDSDWGGLVN